jgi:hypothetical protein
MNVVVDNICTESSQVRAAIRQGSEALVTGVFAADPDGDFRFTMLVPTTAQEGRAILRLRFDDGLRGNYPLFIRAARASAPPRTSQDEEASSPIMDLDRGFADDRSRDHRYSVGGP